MSIASALNVNVYGNSSTTLVLAHGFGLDQSVWRFLIPYLAVYFKVVVLDWAFSPTVKPGFYDPKRHSTFQGYADDLINLIDELHENNTMYMGHSMSGMVGVLASIKRPHLFQHIIMLNSSPRYMNGKEYVGGFEREQIDGVFMAMEEDYLGWVKGFAPMVVGAKNTMAVEEFSKSLGKMDQEIAVRTAKMIFLSDFRCSLPRLRVPCTILQSQIDPVVPIEVAFYMSKRTGLPARVQILNNEGHIPMLTAYPLIFKALRSVQVIK